MREATRLGTVSVNRQRLPCQCLADEGRKNHSVTSCLPWTDRIEKPHNHDRQFFFFPISESQEFIDGFRAGVTPAPLARGAHDQIVGLGKRNFACLTVNLGSAGDEHLFFLLATSKTLSVPLTLVSMVRTGLSTISLTPTDAAR